MPIFPPAAPVTVLIDGRPLPAYVRAYVENGRVFATVAPLLESLADRVWFERGVLVVERDGQRIRVPLGPGFTGGFQSAFVAVGPILRGLGERVEYRRRGSRLEVRTPRVGVVVTPTPYDASAPSAAPRIVFTPQPEPTPRSVWSGSPLPRRTPLPSPPQRLRLGLRL